MRKNDKEENILKKIGENLKCRDKIIMYIFKAYTVKIYRIGVNDAFYHENKKYIKSILK